MTNNFPLLKYTRVISTFIAVAMFIVWVAMVALSKVPASGAAALCASAAFMLITVLYRPTSAFFVSLVTLLTLGLFVKLAYTALSGATPIEPVGDFDYSTTQWDETCFVVAVAFSAVTTVMLLDWLLLGAMRLDKPAISASRFYASIERPLALISVAVAVLCFWVNWRYAVQKVGIDPLIILPGPLHAAVSFTILWGAAFWLGCMAFWSWQAGRIKFAWILALCLIEAFVSGLSNGSRSRYIFHAAAAGLSWIVTRAAGVRVGLKQCVALVCLAGALSASSVVAVSLDRLIAGVYTDRALEIEQQQQSAAAPAAPPTIILPELNNSAEPRPHNNEPARSTAGPAAEPKQDLPRTPEISAAAPSSEQTPEISIAAPSSEQIRSNIPIMVKQSYQLLLQRWTGLEGVMTSVGYPRKSYQLLFDALGERANAAHDGIHEKLSKSTYRKLPGLTFLTLAGSTAILYYSGSLLVVYLGLAFLSVVGIAVERLARLLTLSPFASSLSAVAVALAIAQVNQFYLVSVLCIELVMSSVAVWLFVQLCLRLDRSLINGSEAPGNSAHQPAGR